MPAGEAAFVSLADFVRGRPVTDDAPAPALAAPTGGPPSGSGRPTLAAAPEESAAVEAEVLPGDDSVAAEGLALRDELPLELVAIREAKLFRAALADAFDLLVPNLARELAVEVLGRELRLAAVDLEALARRLVAERLARGPLRLRVAPADSNIACELPVLADPSLGPGDVILECRAGDIDARLRTRLAAVLEAFRP